MIHGSAELSIWILVDRGADAVTLTGTGHDAVLSSNGAAGRA